MGAYIIVPITPPLSRDFDEGHVLVMVENGREIRVRLVENALKGDRQLRVVPVEVGEVHH